MLLAQHRQHIQLRLDMRHQPHRQRIPQVRIIVYQLGQLVMRPARRKRRTPLALIILYLLEVLVMQAAQGLSLGTTCLINHQPLPLGLEVPQQVHL